MGLFGKIKQGVTGKEYIDNFSCPRCGGRVYVKKYLYYCDSCGMLSAEESKKASRAYYSKYDTPETIALMQRKDELEEERRQEALACGDTRKVNGDDYFDYVDDWLNKYFCSPFSHANEGYSGYKMGHLDPEEEKRFGTIQLLKVDKFDGSRKIDEVRIYVIYKSIGVDKSQSNNERLVINFKDFGIVHVIKDIRQLMALLMMHIIILSNSITKLLKNICMKLLRKIYIYINVITSVLMI